MILAMMVCFVAIYQTCFLPWQNIMLSLPRTWLLLLIYAVGVSIMAAPCNSITHCTWWWCPINWEREACLLNATTNQSIRCIGIIIVPIMSSGELLSSQYSSLILLFGGRKPNPATYDRSLDLVLEKLSVTVIYCYFVSLVTVKVSQNDMLWRLGVL